GAGGVDVGRSGPFHQAPQQHAVGLVRHEVVHSFGGDAAAPQQAVQGRGDVVHDEVAHAASVHAEEVAALLPEVRGEGSAAAAGLGPGEGVRGAAAGQ